MAEKLSLGVQIGAALTSGFNNAIGGAREKFNILGKEIKDLSAQRGLIDRVGQDTAALGKARLALTATQKQVANLKLALRADPGNKGLAGDLASAQAKAEKLSIAIEKQKGKLLSSETAMQKAGLKVGALASEYTRLGKTLDETRLKHQKMDAVMTKKSAAGERLGEMKGQILGVAGAAYGAGKVIGEAMEGQYALRMLGNVANLTDKQLAETRLQLRGLARETKQNEGSLLEGFNDLLAKGMDYKTALASMKIVGKTATATGADIKDLAGVAFTMVDAMKLSPEELPRAFDMLHKSGKLGSYELKNMAKDLPMLTAKAKALNLVGFEGVATLGASLQVAVKGASDPAEAANNYKNFLDKISAPETVKRFDKIGISIEKVFKKAVAEGKNPVEEIALLIDKLTKGGDTFRIGELFGDMQVKNFLIAMENNKEDYQRIKAEMLVATGVVDQDFDNISRTAKIQFKSLGISVGQIGNAFAVTLLPSINSALKPMITMATWAGTMVERYPLLGKFIGGVALAIGTFTLATVAVAAATWLWNAALLAVMANPIGLAIAGIALAAGLIITFWEPISAFFSDVWQGIKAGIAPVVAAFAPFAPLFTAIGTAISGMAPYFNAFTTAVSGAFSMVSQLFTPLAATSDAFKSATTVGQRFGILVGQEITKLLTPVTLLMKGLAWAGEKMGLVDRSEVAVGATVRSHNAASVRPDLRLINGGQSSPSTPATPARQFPQVQAANRGGTTTINNVAPATTTITVHAAPGMDEKKLAAEVDRRLDARDSAAQAKKRGALHD